MRPSFFGHVINGFLILIAVVLFFQNYKTISPESMIEFALLFSIAFGIHSIIHFYEEIYYDFNPFGNKWKIRDDAVLNVRNIQ